MAIAAAVFPDTTPCSVIGLAGAMGGRGGSVVFTLLGPGLVGNGGEPPPRLPGPGSAGLAPPLDVTEVVGPGEDGPGTITTSPLLFDFGLTGGTDDGLTAPSVLLFSAVDGAILTKGLVRAATTRALPFLGKSRVTLPPPPLVVPGSGVWVESSLGLWTTTGSVDVVAPPPPPVARSKFHPAIPNTIRQAPSRAKTFPRSSGLMGVTIRSFSCVASLRV
jgi:hypothetical protein